MAKKYTKNKENFEIKGFQTKVFCQRCCEGDNLWIWLFWVSYGFIVFEQKIDERVESRIIA